MRVDEVSFALAGQDQHQSEAGGEDHGREHDDNRRATVSPAAVPGTMSPGISPSAFSDVPTGFHAHRDARVARTVPTTSRALRGVFKSITRLFAKPGKRARREITNYSPSSFALPLGPPPPLPPRPPAAPVTAPARVSAGLCSPTAAEAFFALTATGPSSLKSLPTSVTPAVTSSMAPAVPAATSQETRDYTFFPPEVHGKAVAPLGSVLAARVSLGGASSSDDSYDSSRDGYDGGASCSDNSVDSDASSSDDGVDGDVSSSDDDCADGGVADDTNRSTSSSDSEDEDGLRVPDGEIVQIADSTPTIVVDGLRLRLTVGIRDAGVRLPDIVCCVRTLGCVRSRERCRYTCIRI